MKRSDIQPMPRYPPWGQPMNETSDNLLALAYRCVYGALGSYLAARFAPRNPMRHAIILGVIGFVLSLLGAIATLPLKLGPTWYPIARRHGSALRLAGRMVAP
jgi:hypothetical protein